MENFNITLSSSSGSSNIQLTIQNISPNCYKLSENHLMLNGEIEQDNFVIIDKFTSNKLDYQGVTAKSSPSYIELSSNQSMRSETINLNNAYDLKHDNTYEVYYRASLTYKLCDQLVEVSGFIESNHIDLFN